jgi:hypothetical protein
MSILGPTDRISLSHGHELLLPRSLLNVAREMGDFTSTDFQVDGVFAVTDEGSHSLQPVPVRPGFEWRLYGTPGIGLKWRQVPVDATQAFDGKLDPQMLKMQERLTRRAYDAYGKDVEHVEVLSRDEFLLDERDMSMEQTRKLRGGDPDVEPIQDSVKYLQGVLRRSLITPLFPWLHISRLACMEPPQPFHKKQKEKSKTRPNNSSSSLSESSLFNSENPPPSLPWCRYVLTAYVCFYIFFSGRLLFFSLRMCVYVRVCVCIRTYIHVHTCSPPWLRAGGF